MPTTPDSIEDGALGYAEILRTDGGFALLRMHLEQRELYSVVEGSDIAFLSEDSSQASQRFDQLTGGRSSRLEERHDDPNHNDFLETQPSHLPQLRGKAYRKLAAQAAAWLARHDAH